MIKVGDRVRFLNAVGGGIVRSFQSKDIVLVEEDDGFETPMQVRECVLIESISRETNLPEIKVQTSTPAPIIIRQEPVEEEEYDYEADETPEGENLTVFLAFVPQDIKVLQTTSYDAYLVNDSNYFLHYNIATISLEEAKSQHNGTIEPNTKFLFTSINKDQLNDWEKFSIQLLAFKKKTYAPKPAIDIELKINPVKFYKLHSFTENDYFSRLALMIEVVKGDSIAYETSINPSELKDAMNQKMETPRRSRIGKNPQPSTGILEIDLHITELLDTTAGMSNTEMLQYQLEKFNAVLAENKNKKGQKIVFIHGKGEGVLRTEILKQLKTKYSTYYVQDASFREYGFGATMVTIK